MCSCFCETFCCCLLRFRDSCFPSTRHSSDKLSRNHEGGIVGTSARPEQQQGETEVWRARPEAQRTDSSRSALQRQPRLRAPMPTFEWDPMQSYARGANGRKMESSGAHTDVEGPTGDVGLAAVRSPSRNQPTLSTLYSLPARSPV